MRCGEALLGLRVVEGESARAWPALITPAATRFCTAGGGSAAGACC